MINPTMDFYEKAGVEFLQNSGNGILCKYQNTEYKFYTNSIFKLFNASENLDFMREIRADRTWKRAYGKYIDEQMVELFESDDKSLYQHRVNTQNLDKHTNEVTDFLDNYDIFKVQSPMATRKSNIIEEIIKQCDERGLKVIMVTNRVSLARDISTKYNIDNYQDINSINGHLVCQFDSLHRFHVENFDVCIVDEISSLLNYSTKKHNDTEFYKLNVIKLMALGAYKKLAMLDAFIIDYPWKGRKELGLLNEFRESHKITTYDRKSLFRNRIISMARNNNNISVSSNEKGFLLEISRKLKQENINHILLTGDTKPHVRKKIYESFERKDLDIPVILYSPTLTVGVSIMSTKIENHFHYDVGGTTNVIDSIQMIRRARNAKKIHLFLRARSSIAPMDLDTIEYNMVDFVDIDDFGNRRSITKSGRLFSRVKRMNNIMENSSKYALLHLLNYQFQNTPDPF